MVYHGGSVGDTFSAQHNGTGGGRESAFFFTPDIRQAKDYAGNGEVKAVYLAANNPLNTDVQLEPSEVALAKADARLSARHCRRSAHFSQYLAFSTNGILNPLQVAQGAA